METNIAFLTYQNGLLIEIQLMVAVQFGERCVVREKEFEKNSPRKNIEKICLI